MNPFRRISTLLFASAFLLLTAGPALACPTCKDSLHHNNAALGYAISICFMMAMPMLIAAFWTVLIWRLRNTAATAGANPASSTKIPATHTEIATNQALAGRVT